MIFLWERGQSMELQTSLLELKGVGKKKYESLNRLGLFTVYDLLTYYPRTYEDRRILTPLAAAAVGEQQAVVGVIRRIAERRTGRGLHVLSVDIDDGTGFLQVTFFNQSFLKGKLRTGMRLFAVGKIDYAFGGQGKKQMSQVKDFSVLEKDEDVTLGLLPVYAATSSLNQKFFRTLLTTLFQGIDEIAEILPGSICQRYHLVAREEAYREVHFPESSEALHLARERLIFEELYLIQCGLLLLRRESREKKKGVRHLGESRLSRAVHETLPFRLTEDQAKAWCDIRQDMELAVPMRRRLGQDGSRPARAHQDGGKWLPGCFHGADGDFGASAL